MAYIVYRNFFSNKKKNKSVNIASVWLGKKTVFPIQNAHVERAAIEHNTLITSDIVKTY